MLITTARDEDWSAIWPLLRTTFRAGDTYAVAPDITEDAARAMWMGTPKAIYVALIDGRVVGTYYIKTNQPGGGSHVCNCGYITDPSVRGQGIASRMCDHSLGAAKALGYTAMQFNFVLATNEGALRIWDRKGFEIVGNLPKAFLHPQKGMVDVRILFRTL